jgi:hypothetical protein
MRPKRPVQIEGGTDQSQMGERLGEIAGRSYRRGDPDETKRVCEAIIACLS